MPRRTRPTRALTRFAALLVATVLAGVAADALAAYDAGVERAQARLAAIGFDPGAVDGLMGRRTRRAIRAFQADRGLRETGRLDARTLAALFAGDAVPAAGAARTVPAPAAGALPAIPLPPDPAPADPPEPVEAAPSAGAAGSAPASESPAQAPVARAPDTPAPDTSAPDPAPVPEAPPASNTRPERIPYDTLGWPAPSSAEAILERHRAAGGSPLRGPAEGLLIVPDGAHVYLLAPGERIPALGCDPAAGELGIELMLGGEGSAMVSRYDGPGPCQLGLGVVLRQGMVVDFEELVWGDVRYPGGRVRLGAGALEYVEYR